MSVEEKKRELRKYIRSLPPEEAPSGPAVADALCALDAYKKAKTVFVFVSNGDEPETRDFIVRALDEGKVVAVPKCLPDGIMEARQIGSLSELVTGMYGIPEPGDQAPPVQRCRIDFAVVPGLCFDMDGGRLGKGKGYYDRFLQDFPGIKAGICSARRLVPSVPMDKWDVFVDVTVVI